MSEEDRQENDYITYEFRIYPNREHVEKLKNQFGCVRFVYNRFFALSETSYQETGHHRSYSENASDLTQLKRDPEYDWLKAVHSQPLQQALTDLQSAYGNFFAGRAEKPRRKEKKGWQKFRYPQGVKLDPENKRCYLPKVGWMKTVFHREFPDIELMTAVTVRLSPGGMYHILCLFERPPEKVAYTGGKLGLDVGLTNFVTTSEGEKIPNPKHLQKSFRRLKRYQRQLSRKKYNSNGWKKARRKVAKLHEKIARQRNDFLHRLSYHMTHENQMLRVETLNIQGMMQNRHLAQAIGTAGWHEFKRQLEYKGKWYGCHIEEVPMFFASTKLCHDCHSKNGELTLSDREWQCPNCGAVHDRDINAARNIRDYDIYCTAGSVGDYAGGGDGSVHHLSDGLDVPRETGSHHL